MPSDKPRLSVCITPRLRGDFQGMADARETTVSEVTRNAALRREIRRKDLITRAMPTTPTAKGGIIMNARGLGCLG